jgi:hypothetical protein
MHRKITCFEGDTTCTCQLYMALLASLLWGSYNYLCKKSFKLVIHYDTYWVLWNTKEIIHV